jgi:hypothetical protein
VIIDDKEIEASSKGEEIQPIPTELPIPSANMIKPSTSPQETLGMSPAAESLPVHTTSDTTVSASEDEDIPTNPPKRSWVKHNHPSQQLIGTLKEWRWLRNIVIQPSSGVANQVSYSCYLAQTESKKVEEAIQDESWVSAMHNELHQFTKNDVWTLVPRLADHNIIGTKWIFKNKSDEHGTVVKNKARLVAQGYTQIERIDFDETFALIARLKSIRILLSIACHPGFKLYQMDVNSAFLNSILQEEVYVEQPKGFQDPFHPHHVYKLKKALYGLKQAPRAWYERLTTYLLAKGFTRG